MRNKRLAMYIGIIIIVIILIVVGYFVYKKITEEDSNEFILEYIPQEEISEKQLRQTVVTLYFLDSDSYELVPEARRIDSKELINDPYEVLINLLIDGPQNEKLLKVIPDGTVLRKAEIKDNVLLLDLSDNFIKEQNLGKEQEEIILKSIVNTVTELTEINKVAFLIEGVENMGFPDKGVVFDKVFVRE